MPEEKTEVWTVQRMLDWSRQYFEKNGMDSPQLDAQILLGHLLNMSKMQLLINGQRPLSADELAAYKKLLIRRAKNHEPIAYILGNQGFWSLELDVCPDVLIPRPDTECLVEKAIEFARSVLDNKNLPWMSTRQELTYEKVDHRQEYYNDVQSAEALEEKADAWMASAESRLSDLTDEEKMKDFQAKVLGNKDENGEVTGQSEANSRVLKIVDVGTGSGAIILAIASELGARECDLTAIDISSKALEVARHNAKKCNMSDRIHFIESDLLAKYPDKADIIVSNPPYISTSEMKDLPAEVKKEPVLALEAGAEGLDIYRRLVPQAVNKLQKGGALIVEIGYTQSASVEKLFTENGLHHVMTFKDYGRQPRVVLGIR